MSLDRLESQVRANGEALAELRATILRLADSIALRDLHAKLLDDGVDFDELAENDR